MSKYTLIVPIAADTDKMGTEMPYLFGLDSNVLRKIDHGVTVRSF